MAVTAVTATELVLDTRSADLPIASWTAIATGADGFTLDLSGFGNIQAVILGFEDNAGCTITMTAGARPPAEHAGRDTASGTEMPLGRKITLAANDVRFIAIDRSRFMSAAGLIAGISSTDTTTIIALVVPKGY
jgi:hypothetical protein